MALYRDFVMQTVSGTVVAELASKILYISCGVDVYSLQAVLSVIPAFLVCTDDLKVLCTCITVGSCD